MRSTPFPSTAFRGPRLSSFCAARNSSSCWRVIISRACTGSRRRAARRFSQTDRDHTAVFQRRCARERFRRKGHSRRQRPATNAARAYPCWCWMPTGTKLVVVLLAAPATGIAATRQNLIVTNARGLLRYAAADIVPDATAEVQCTLITPLLQSQDSEGGFPWLRVDASTTLPEGTTLEISYAATDDPEVRDRVKAIAQDARLPASQRIQQLLHDPEIQWPKTIFHGSDQEPEAPEAARSAPLFDVRERYLWVCVTLTAARGARLPAVTRTRRLVSGPLTGGEPAHALPARCCAARRFSALARGRARGDDAGSRRAHCRAGQLHSSEDCLRTVDGLHRPLAGLAVGRRAGR